MAEYIQLERVLIQRESSYLFKWNLSEGNPSIWLIFKFFKIL